MTNEIKFQYRYNYTEQNFGGDTTRDEADNIAEALKYSVEEKFENVDFETHYDPNWGSASYADTKEEEELIEDIKHFLDQNWSDIAGQVLDGTFWDN